MLGAFLGWSVGEEEVGGLCEYEVGDGFCCDGGIWFQDADFRSGSRGVLEWGRLRYWCVEGYICRLYAC